MPCWTSSPRQRFSPQMVRRAARGPVDYVMAHRIAVIDERMGFWDALMMARAYVAHGAAKFLVGRHQPMSLAAAKRLTRDGWTALEALGELPDLDVTFRIKAAPLDVPSLPYHIESTVIPAYTGEGEWWACLTEAALDVLDQAWVKAHRESQADAVARVEPLTDHASGWPEVPDQMELEVGSPRPEQGTLG